LLVIGASAGGGRAAGATLMARDLGTPAIAHQMLVFPMLDDRMITASSQKIVGTGVWDATANRTGCSALLGAAAGGPDVSPYAAPARATDLTGLPPTSVDVGSAEVFRDEAIDYASRLPGRVPGRPARPGGQLPRRRSARGRGGRFVGDVGDARGIPAPRSGALGRLTPAHAPGPAPPRRVGRPRIVRGSLSWRRARASCTRPGS